MSNRRKSLRQQTIVITGASSGIGLATARLAAKQGAAVVLAARSGDVLDRTVREIEDGGGRALAVIADVGVEGDVRRIVEMAIERFGEIDTWVNNAGVSAYATLTDLPLGEHRKIFETNYWGVVHGSLLAVEQFRRQSAGGTVVNVGSVNSDVPIPLLSAYSASKHAVKGFTDALRMELLAARDPISVTLIKPSGIATPFPQHARNHLRREPRVLPPLYAPELVADAILHAATHPTRDLTIGGAGRLIALASSVAPRLTDAVLAGTVPRLTKSNHSMTRTDNLETAGAEGDVHYPYFSGLRFSPFTAAQKSPSAVAVIGLGLVALFSREKGQVVSADAGTGPPRVHAGRMVSRPCARPWARGIAPPIPSPYDKLMPCKTVPKPVGG